MHYPDWYDDDKQREFLVQEYDKFMADSYRRCLVNDWWFPQEVMDWFNFKKDLYILEGEHPVTAQHKVVKEQNLSRDPWSFMHLSEGGQRRWNASPENEAESMPIPAPAATLSAEVRIDGHAHTADLAPGEALEVLTPHGTRISVHNTWRE